MRSSYRSGILRACAAEPPALKRRGFPANSIRRHTAEIHSPTAIAHSCTATIENLRKFVALALSSVGKHYKEPLSSGNCGGNATARPPKPSTVTGLLGEKKVVFETKPRLLGVAPRAHHCIT